MNNFHNPHELATALRRLHQHIRRQEEALKRIESFLIIRQ